MNFATPTVLRVVLILVALVGCRPADESTQAGNEPTSRSKEVLLHEDGKDRHWLIRSNALIIEEHYLTAHGDLHVMIEYPRGVRTPQGTAETRDANAESVMTVFWPHGKRMSRTPATGGEPNGQDLVWWPNGQLAREAHFVIGTPTGVWKYYNLQGKLVGEGLFVSGQRQSGVFVGKDAAGGDFFLTDYPMRKETFEHGKLKDEEVFLKELPMQ